MDSGRINLPVPKKNSNFGAENINAWNMKCMKFPFGAQHIFRGYVVFREALATISHQNEATKKLPDPKNFSTSKSPGCVVSRLWVACVGNE